MRRQRGQSMIEYTVVVGALFLALAATTLGPDEQNMDGLLAAMKEHGRAYSHAISLSDIPDTEDPETIREELIAAGVPPDKADMMAYPDRYWREFDQSAGFEVPGVGSFEIKPSDVLEELL